MKEFGKELGNREFMVVGVYMDILNINVNIINSEGGVVFFQ